MSPALIGLVARGLAAASGGHSPSDSALFRRFETMLEQHYAKRWNISDYAATLSVTPTHLNRVTRAAAGDTASHLIRYRMVREARRNLV